MNKVVVDAAMREKLKGLLVPLELYDEQGHILARVSPVLDPALWVPDGPELTAEEWAERLNYSGPTLTTDEVRAMLRKP